MSKVMSDHRSLTMERETSRSTEKNSSVYVEAPVMEIETVIEASNPIEDLSVEEKIIRNKEKIDDLYSSEVTIRDEPILEFPLRVLFNGTKRVLGQILRPIQDDRLGKLETAVTRGTLAPYSQVFWTLVIPKSVDSDGEPLSKNDLLCKLIEEEPTVVLHDGSHRARLYYSLSEDVQQLISNFVVNVRIIELRPRAWDLVMRNSHDLHKKLNLSTFVPDVDLVHLMERHHYSLQLNAKESLFSKVDRYNLIKGKVRQFVEASQEDLGRSREVPRQLFTTLNHLGILPEATIPLGKIARFALFHPALDDVIIAMIERGDFLSGGHTWSHCASLSHRNPDLLRPLLEARSEGKFCEQKSFSAKLKTVTEKIKGQQNLSNRQQRNSRYYKKKKKKNVVLDDDLLEPKKAKIGQEFDESTREPPISADLTESDEERGMTDVSMVDHDEDDGGDQRNDSEHVERKKAAVADVEQDVEQRTSHRFSESDTRSSVRISQRLRCGREKKERKRSACTLEVANREENDSGSEHDESTLQPEALKIMSKQDEPSSVFSRSYTCKIYRVLRRTMYNNDRIDTSKVYLVNRELFESRTEELKKFWKIGHALILAMPGRHRSEYSDILGKCFKFGPPVNISPCYGDFCVCWSVREFCMHQHPWVDVVEVVDSLEKLTAPL